MNAHLLTLPGSKSLPPARPAIARGRRRKLPRQGALGLGVARVEFPHLGVEEVVEWDLSAYEREQLGEAVDKLSEQYDEIA